nr:unnamed protein product [Haemonchus contortus]
MWMPTLLLETFNLEPISFSVALIAGTEFLKPPLCCTVILRTWTKDIVDIPGRFRLTPALLNLEKKNRADLSFVHADFDLLKKPHESVQDKADYIFG